MALELIKDYQQEKKPPNRHHFEKRRWAEGRISSKKLGKAWSVSSVRTESPSKDKGQDRQKKKINRLTCWEKKPR